MATPTQGNLFQKPQEGLDDNTWGTTLNANLDKLDAMLSGRTQVPGLDVTGGVRVRGVLTIDKAPEVALDDSNKDATEIDLGDIDPAPIYIVGGQVTRINAAQMAEGRVVDLIFLYPDNSAIEWNNVAFGPSTMARPPGTLRERSMVRLYRQPGDRRVTGFKLTP